MKNRAILFDLDGTLIDQFDAIHQAFSQTLVTMGFSAPSYDQVKRAVGGASQSTMTKLIGPERATEAVHILRPIFEEKMLSGLKILPGVLEGLKLINENGWDCAVLTNKYGPHARASCKHLGIDKFLKFIIGAEDTEWKKPNPKLTQLAVAQLGVSFKEAIYVGDSPYDFETAKNAGLPCHLISSGTHSLEELKNLQKEQVYPNFQSFIDSIFISH